MRTEIIFKDIRRSPYIENFITDKIEALIDKIGPLNSDLHWTVRVQEDRLSTSARHPVFHCEITLKSGASAKPQVVTKQDRNLFRAIVAAFDTLKVLLSKSHERLRQDHRQARPIG